VGDVDEDEQGGRREAGPFGDPPDGDQHRDAGRHEQHGRLDMHPDGLAGPPGSALRGLEQQERSRWWSMACTVFPSYVEYQRR
jgi:hypothetical protein